MGNYVSKVTFEINGQLIDDFKAFTENSIELKKPVKLMKKRGFVAVTPDYGFSLEYVVPETDAEFDFEGITDARVTVEYDNGKRKTYSGVETLTIGEEKVDGENETVRTIEFGAIKRIVE